MPKNFEPSGGYEYSQLGGEKPSHQSTKDAQVKFESISPKIEEKTKNA